MPLIELIDDPDSERQPIGLLKRQRVYAKRVL
jgi:hypothetical protein